MSRIKNIGQYLDQPILVGKFSKAVPTVLGTIATVYGVREVHKAPEHKKKKTATYAGIILASTVLSSLVAPKIATKAVGRAYEKVDLNKIYSKNTTIIDEFIAKNTIKENIQKDLEKAKNKVLNIKEVSELRKELTQTDQGNKLLKELIPEPENITSKDILKDMGRLSIMGAIPVVGGIAGGTIADVITDKPHWQEKFPDKVKEGVYQYLANIFLCNVGAASALGFMESLKVKSKAIRALSMVAGIIITGVVGGSFIANYISKKVVTPALDKKFRIENNEKTTAERKPEIIDVCLHTDDVATIAVMSGFKWIEPALPILYAISGYRAAVGYRGKEPTKPPLEKSKTLV